MSQVNTPMNFLPEDYVEKRQAARAAVVFIGLLLVVVGGIVGAFMFTQWQMKTVFDAHDKVNAQFEDASKQIKTAQDLEQQKEAMVKKAEIIATLMERVRRSALLGELVRLRPASVNFVNVELTGKAIDSGSRPKTDLDRAMRQQQGLSADVARSATMDVSVSLTATAKTDAEVAAYIAALGKSTLLTEVTLMFSEEYKRGKDDANAETLRRFRVDMKVNPSADLRGGGSLATVEPGK